MSLVLVNRLAVSPMVTRGSSKDRIVCPIAASLLRGGRKEPGDGAKEEDSESAPGTGTRMRRRETGVKINKIK